MRYPLTETLGIAHGIKNRVYPECLTGTVSAGEVGKGLVIQEAFEENDSAQQYRNTKFQVEKTSHDRKDRERALHSH
jgi:hypothetical protein